MDLYWVASTVSVSLDLQTELEAALRDHRLIEFDRWLRMLHLSLVSILAALKDIIVFILASAWFPS